MTTVSELVDKGDIPEERKDHVKNVLHGLGYAATRAVGKAFLKITEKHMTDAGMIIADANAILAEVESLQAAQEQALSSARQKQAGAVDTREQSDLTTELKKVIKALQDNMTLTQLVLRGQLRPVTSSASTKRLEDYRRRAIEYYYGSHADMSRIMCMVTGEEFDVKQITAGHIYRQGWGTGIVNAMGCRLHDPCNIILMQKQLEKRFDNWEWTIIPEGSDVFRIHVLNPQLLDSKGLEQYITGHAGKSTKWGDINKTLLHLPPIARPARRICGLHAMLAVQEADDKGWFDEHEAPEVTEASWESPKFDGQLMSNFLGDSNTAGMFHTNDSEAD